MKIGIITFHWAENYGAVLQCYALQSYFEDEGHEVEIINYQPFSFGLYYLSLLFHPQLLLRLSKIHKRKQKQTYLDIFRRSYLHLTKRYYTCTQLQNAHLEYDMIISGSDQVLNPSFTVNGENRPTPTYYIPFGNCKKIGYALSFGCTDYPTDAKEYAGKWIQNFDAIGIRENTGIGVLNQLGYKNNQQVVPDPTILYYRNLFQRLSLKQRAITNYCVYVLRHRLDFGSEDFNYIDEEHKPVNMETWIESIIFSKGLITNSYHGMIVAILNHIPFVALLETNAGKGMNDRFYTLLDNIGLNDHVQHIDSKTDTFFKIIAQPIDWENVDRKIELLSGRGREFLNMVMSESIG